MQNAFVCFLIAVLIVAAFKPHGIFVSVRGWVRKFAGTVQTPANVAVIANANDLGSREPILTPWCHVRTLDR